MKLIKGNGIMSLMLSVKSYFTNFWDNFVAKISTTTIIVALCFLVVGLTCTILASRFARISCKSNEVPENNKTLVVFKVIGIFFVFGAFLIFILV